jgi:hypothetical protein
VNDEFVHPQVAKSSFATPARCLQTIDEKCPLCVQNSSFTARAGGRPPAPEAPLTSFPR